MRRLRAADGIALPVAMILMMIMLGIALGLASYIDLQSAQTRKERNREVAFNLAEAALNAQVYQLSQHWPGQANQKYGACGTDPSVASAVAGSAPCPAASALSNLIPAVDTTAGATWRTDVYDDTNGLQTFFADSRITNQPGYDSDGDGKVWVRAQATVAGKTRALISLVRTQLQAEAVPHAAVIAQSLDVSNNGLKTVIAAGDSTNGAVDVRCSISSGGTCLAQPLGTPPTADQTSWYNLVSQQINPPVWQDGYSAPTFTADELSRFIATAQAFNTYYTSCPSTLTGSVVVIAGDLGQCKYNANSVYNSSLQPGFLIILNSGTSLLLDGGATFYGVVYYANQPSASGGTQNTGTAVTVQGTAQVIGGVIIDGPASLTAGSSGGNGNNATPNVVFDDHGFGAVQSLSSTNIIPNSWREIVPGQ